MKWTPSCKSDPAESAVCRESSSTRACLSEACSATIKWEAAAVSSRKPMQRKSCLRATGSFYDANIDEKRVRHSGMGRKGRDNKAGGVECSNTKKAPAFNRRFC